VRRPAIVLLCLALAVLALSACGGGDDEAAGDDETVVVTETSADEATPDDPGTTGLDTSGLGDLPAEDCLRLVTIGAAIAQTFTGAGGAQTEETSALLERLSDDVPDDIRADIETLAAGYSEYADAVRDLDLEAGQTPSGDQLQQIQAAIASIDQPGLQAASERVSTWAETNC